MVPTIFEIGLVCAVLGYSFGPMFAGVTGATLVVYVGFTVGITQWRTKFRKMMNASENRSD